MSATIPGGFFVAFEGGENTGKSTQVKIIGEWLHRELGLETTVTRAPGGTMAGKRIRELLLYPGTEEIDPLTEAFLFAADRRQHAVSVIRPDLAAGKIIVSDRWSDSAVAYQGNGRGLGFKAVRDLNDWAAGGIIPDLTVVLDMDPGRARCRHQARRDRIESEPPEFHERVRQAFLVIADGKGHRYLVVDADQERDEVTRQIQGRILHELATRGVPLTLLDKAASDLMRKREFREDEQQTLMLDLREEAAHRGIDGDSTEVLLDASRQMARRLGLVVEEPHGKYGAIARLPEPPGGNDPETQLWLIGT